MPLAGLGSQPVRHSTAFVVDKTWIQSKFISGSTYDFSPMLSQYCSLSNCNLGKFANATIRYYK